MGFWKDNFDSLKVFFYGISSVFRSAGHLVEDILDERRIEKDLVEEENFEKMLSYFWEEPKAIVKHIMPDVVGEPLSIGNHKMTTSSIGFWILGKPNDEYAFYATHTCIQEISIKTQSKPGDVRCDLTIHAIRIAGEPEEGSYTFKNITPSVKDAILAALENGIKRCYEVALDDLTPEELIFVKERLEIAKEAIQRPRSENS